MNGRKAAQYKAAPEAAFSYVDTHLTTLEVVWVLHFLPGEA